MAAVKTEEKGGGGGGSVLRKERTKGKYRLEKTNKSILKLIPLG